MRVNISQLSYFLIKSSPCSELKKEHLVGHLSITQVSVRYKISKNTVNSAVQRKYLKSFQNNRHEHFILEEDANFYFKGPPFPYWWSFQHIASLGIPLTVLYTMKERYDFRWILWKKRLYAYIPGERGIEGNLKALGFLPHSKPMLQMARPIFDK